VLSRNTHVEEINFHANSLGPQGAEYVARCLRLNKRVVALNMGANDITDKGVYRLGETLGMGSTDGAPPCQLVSISLYNNKISDVGCHTLALALKSNVCLNHIDLAGNSITCTGAKELAGVLAGTQSLKEVVLAYNLIRDEGANALVTAVEENKSIIKLELGGNHFSRDIMVRLEKALRGNSKLHELEKLRERNAKVS
jgi:Ran GTPase-activating protein (RanGAP) involved in mRNA processing and transport